MSRPKTWLSSDMDTLLCGRAPRPKSMFVSKFCDQPGNFSWRVYCTAHTDTAIGPVNSCRVNREIDCLWGVLSKPKKNLIFRHSCVFSWHRNAPKCGLNVIYPSSKSQGVFSIWIVNSGFTLEEYPEKVFLRKICCYTVKFYQCTPAIWALPYNPTVCTYGIIVIDDRYRHDDRYSTTRIFASYFLDGYHRPQPE